LREIEVLKVNKSLFRGKKAEDKARERKKKESEREKQMFLRIIKHSELNNKFELIKLVSFKD
jgi:hypothetical protein